MKQTVALLAVLTLCALVMQFSSAPRLQALPGFAEMHWERVQWRSLSYAPFASSEPVIFETTDAQTISSLVQLLLEQGVEWAPASIPEVLPKEQIEFYGPGAAKMTFLQGEYYLYQQPGPTPCMSRLFRNPARENLYERLRSYQKH